MTEKRMQGPDGKISFGKIVREKIATALNSSHHVIDDVSRNVFEALSSMLINTQHPEEELEYQIPILVEYALYGADDSGRDLGEVSHGILQGVWKTAQELHLNAHDLVERTARAMILESDWRDIDLRIVIENFINRSFPDGKALVKKIFSSEDYMKAA
ncbi:MAG: hypothetical protein HZC17_03615 [Candidatus Omnitrophica bacterium]|nr:hypothetical protein [Candidatus Omnitrophota bacterium]